MAVKNSSKDAAVIKKMLAEMGVTDYEPRVVNQLIEFTYRYTTEALEDARMLSNHLGKKAIDVDDVKLACRRRVENTFNSPPSRELLLEVAKTRNSIPLPAIKPFSGSKLPPDKYCLTAPNFKQTSNSKKNKLQASKLSNQSNKSVISFVSPQSLNNISLKKP